MNVLRKAMADEAAQLKPLLDRTYREILRYQEYRTEENENRLREALEPTIEQLMVFRPYMPAYKQEYFNLLESEWRNLGAGDLIMLFDHCVNIMHLRLERMLSAGEAQQPWSRELLELLAQRRQAPTVVPASGDFLCSGIGAVPGRVVGIARVVEWLTDLATLQAGEILVCRMSTPDWIHYVSRIAGLVTDQGGSLRHAAIVARELGLPCVTGCGNATTVITTGDRIEVNGDLGLVTSP